MQRLDEADEEVQFQRGDSHPAPTLGLVEAVTRQQATQQGVRAGQAEAGGRGELRGHVRQGYLVVAALAGGARLPQGCQRLRDGAFRARQVGDGDYGHDGLIAVEGKGARVCFIGQVVAGDVDVLAGVADDRHLRQGRVACVEVFPAEPQALQ